MLRARGARAVQRRDRRRDGGRRVDGEDPRRAPAAQAGAPRPGAARRPRLRAGPGAGPAVVSRRLQAFLPELRPVDAVVAGVLLVMVAIAALSLAAQDPGEVPIVAALVIGAVQTLPVLWRRERPIAALLVYAVSVVPAALIVGSALTLYTWAVLLFAVVRRLPPLPGAVAVVGTSLVIPVLVGVVLQPGEVDTALGAAVGLPASLLPVLAVAGALGIVARLRAERLGAQRRRDERDRLADALAEQRDRLAGDLRGLVAVRVEHVVARTRRWPPPTPQATIFGPASPTG